MKAVIYHEYGSPDVLGCDALAQATIGDAEVPMRIRAAAVNPVDCHLMSGTYIIRSQSGLVTPRPTCPEANRSGEVAAHCRNVTRFQPRDAVFHGSGGAFVEYAPAHENRLALEPANLAFEQVAGRACGGIERPQRVRAGGRMQFAAEVLISGAAGSGGHVRRSITKSRGTEEIAMKQRGNCGRHPSDGRAFLLPGPLILSAQRYDLIFDCVGHRPSVTPINAFHPPVSSLRLSAAGDSER